MTVRPDQVIGSPAWAERWETDRGPYGAALQWTRWEIRHAEPIVYMTDSAICANLRHHEQGVAGVQVWLTGNDREPCIVEALVAAATALPGRRTGVHYTVSDCCLPGPMEDDLLHIADDHREVIYRVRREAGIGDAWRLTWPD